MTKRWAVISAGVVENVVLADAQLDPSWVDLTNVNPEPSLGWLLGNGIFSPPDTPALPNVITKVAMLSRFTDEEFVGIVGAAKTDIEVEAWKIKFDAAGTINLDDSRTQAGMALLVSKNLLTQARAVAILTDPIQPGEGP